MREVLEKEGKEMIFHLIGEMESFKEWENLKKLSLPPFLKDFKDLIFYIRGSLSSHHLLLPRISRQFKKDFIGYTLNDLDFLYKLALTQDKEFIPDFLEIRNEFSKFILHYPQNIILHIREEVSKIYIYQDFS